MKSFNTLTSRRNFLTTIGLASACSGFPVSSHAKEAHEKCPIVDSSEAWKRVPDILAKIKPPVFPNQQFNVLDFGATKNSNRNSRKAIQQAIDKCTCSGGGRVVSRGRPGRGSPVAGGCRRGGANAFCRGIFHLPDPG